MRLLSQLVLAFALLAALAAATPRSKRGKSFSVKQVSRKVTAESYAGHHALSKAYRKLRHTPPALKKATPKKSKAAVANKAVAQKDAASDQSTEEAKPDQQDTQYVCEVDIADGKFRLNFDTGSSDL